jgi:hypothetical protein
LVINVRCWLRQRVPLKRRYMSNVLHGMTFQKTVDIFTILRAQEDKSHVYAFILMPTEVILIKFRYASLKWLWKTAGVSPTILGFWIVYHKSSTAFTTFVNLELNLCLVSTKGGAVFAVVKFMTLQLAALHESTVLSPRFSFHLMTSWFTWTLLMAYSKAKLKSDGNKASPCFNPFLIGDISDRCLPTRTL